MIQNDLILFRKQWIPSFVWINIILYSTLQSLNWINFKNMMMFLPLFGEERSWYILSHNSQYDENCCSSSWAKVVFGLLKPRGSATVTPWRLVIELFLKGQTMPIITSFSLCFSRSYTWQTVPHNSSQFWWQIWKENLGDFVNDHSLLLCKLVSNT